MTALYEWNGQHMTASQIAAAEGVTVNAIYMQMKRHGTIDGLGQKGRGRYPGNPVSVNGRSWRTQRDFAAYVGRTEKHVSRSLNAGRLDLLEGMLAKAEGRQ